MGISYTLVHTRRKTIQIQVSGTGAVLVRAPRGVSRKEVDRFVAQKADWITESVSFQKARYANRILVSNTEAQALKEAAKEALPALTNYWARMMGVSCAGVRITAAARRWGSCSPRGSICYSWRVMLLPSALREYIVVHELAHLRVRSHAPAFYAEVGRWLPDYSARIKALHAFEAAHPIVQQDKAEE